MAKIKNNKNYVRVTIILAQDLSKKLRLKQAKVISTKGKNQSFSKTIDIELRKTL